MADKKRIEAKYPPPGIREDDIPKRKEPDGFFRMLFKLPFLIPYWIFKDLMGMIWQGTIWSIMGIIKLLLGLGLLMGVSVILWYLFVVAWTFLRANYIG